MQFIRRSADRGVGEHGWLSSRHTFSFAGYYDPRFTGFRDLLVINEDKVAGGRGFGAHGHRDMEIISYVLDGALEHRDSEGNRSVIRPGDVQRMSAGTGVLHSEYNHSREAPVHFLQIWIRPEKRGLAPSYEEKRFTETDTRNRLRLVASRDGRDGSVTIHQSADLYAVKLDPEHAVKFDLKPGRHLWLHVARGAVRIGGETLGAGDALASDEAGAFEIVGDVDAEVLLFDLG